MSRKKLTITRPLPGTVDLLPDSLPEFLRTSQQHLAEDTAVEDADEPAEAVIVPQQGVCTLKVKKLHPDAVVPKLATPGAACFDLHAIDVSHQVLLPGRPTKVRTGLAFEVPPGYALMVYSRSGHGFKSNTRLSNCVGVIDSDYRGEVMVSLYRDDSVNDHFSAASAMKIHSGDRVAQAMLIPVPAVAFEEVNVLSSTDRGTGGFGSTG